MKNVMCLYLDDSGTRNPDRNPGDKLGHHGHDWFALGGVIVRNDEDEADIRRAHQDLCDRWQIKAPLHSSEIRSRKDGFAWLGSLDASGYRDFMSDLTHWITTSKLVATACVIDRPGYNQRYRDKYGPERWSLCKTAFNVVVERAAKFAISHGCRLRVDVERADKKTDRLLESYYNELRNQGLPFDPANSARYEPLSAGELKTTLYEFRKSSKESIPIQLADLCLWPICMGGYDPKNVAYASLKDAGLLIDCVLSPDRLEREGIKYSCWPKTQKPD